MKSKRKWFTRVFLLFLLVGLLTLAIFPGTSSEAEKAEKQEKESTSFFKRVGKGIGALFKPSNLRLELNGGWSAWGVGDFKGANEFIENTYQGSATHTAETTGFSGSLLGGLKVFAEYRLSNSHKLGLGTGFKFLPGGSFEQVVTSPTESITRGFDMSAFAIPLELSYKMPLKMKIFKKPLSLRFGAGLDFISSTIDYVFDRSVTAANGGLNNLSRTAANGSEHTVINFRDSALGGHISVGLEYPFSKNFGLTLDAGYAFGNLDRFTGTYTDQHGEQRDVVLGKDSEYGEYIIPYTYHDTICPSLTTASLIPGGFSITVGISFSSVRIKQRGKDTRYGDGIQGRDWDYVGDEPPGRPWLESDMLPEKERECNQLIYIWNDYQGGPPLSPDEKKKRDEWWEMAYKIVDTKLKNACVSYCKSVQQIDPDCTITHYRINLVVWWWRVPRLLIVAECECMSN